jgi:trigger factor
MSAALETLDGLKRRLTLNVATANLEGEVSKRFAKLARTVKMDGFRPGKVPMKMVIAHYGNDVRAEVLSEALETAFFAAIDEQKIAVAGYPSFAPLPEGQGFTATFEVFPEIKVGDVGAIKVTRQVAAPDAADVDRTLDVLRKQRMHWHTVERSAVQGDRAHISFIGKIDGRPFPGGEGRDFPVVLGEGRTLPEFEGALDGMTAGEQKSAEVSFPEDYFAKDLAGKTAVFDITVESVQESHLPDLDDAFAATLGVENVEKLRADVADNLARECKRRISSRVKEQVMNGLLEITPFDVPQSLVAREQQEMMEKAHHDLKQRGMKDSGIHMGPEMFADQAKRRISLGLLLNALADAEKIEADATRVREIVEDFAKSYEDPSEVINWYMQNAERRQEVEAIAKEEALVDWVLARAQVTDEPTNLQAIMGGE